MLRRGIESPEQLEELGINVYASVPVSEWLINKNTKKQVDEILRKIAKIILAC